MTESGEFIQKHPVSIRITTKKNKGDQWDSKIVEIFTSDNKTKLGEYERIYPSFGEATFCPFQIEDQWYALYSYDYQKTSVMKLPSCEKWCEVEDDEFCPTEHYVPRYRTQVSKEPRKSGDPEDFYKFWVIEGSRDFDGYWEDNKDFNGYEDKDYKYGPIKFLSKGFVSGCYWGDDSSWKIGYLDLSGIPKKKIIKKPYKFGELHLPDGMKLRDAIEFYFYDFDPVAHDKIRITHTSYFNLKDGKNIDDE